MDNVLKTIVHAITKAMQELRKTNDMRGRKREREREIEREREHWRERENNKWNRQALSF